MPSVEPARGEGASAPPQDALAAISSTQSGPRSAAKLGSSMPVVPGYEMVRVLGRGGMGVVWEAIEHRLDRKGPTKAGPSRG